MGASIGTSQGFGIYTDSLGNIHENWTFTFPNGALEFSGMFSSNGLQTASVVGGTGIYQGAKGQIVYSETQCTNGGLSCNFVGTINIV